MGLISVHNFAVPIKNKWHLVTICVLALLFGVWRSSGGGFEARPLNTRQLGNPNAVQEYRGEWRSHVAPNTAPQRKAAPQGRQIDSLLERQPQAVPPTSDQGSRNKSALDDIEKSLGLR